MQIGVLILAAATFGRVPLTPCTASDGQTKGLCGSIQVWENRAAKTGRKIPIRILILPALTDRPAADPVVLFAGGPGESAVDSAPHMGVVAALRGRRHVVAIDQRGTGGSNPLPCAAKDLANPGAVVGGLFDLDRVRRCRAELEKRADLTQYTTTNFVDDVDEVREALGFPQISLYGGSYGTESALVYLRRHESRARAVALKAVKPVQHKLPLLLSRTIQASMDALLEGRPELARDVKTILAGLAKAPAKLALEGQPASISTGTFLSGMRLLLYYPRQVEQLPRMLHEAARGNWTPFASAHLAIVRNGEPRIFRGLHFSVVCSEDVAATTEAEIARETATTWLGDFQVRHYQEVCKLWPRGAAPAGFFDPVRSSKPVLLIAGENDPATPAASARIVAETLPNSRVIAIPGGTHMTASPCIDDLVARFIDSTRTDGLPSCLEAR